MFPRFARSIRYAVTAVSLSILAAVLAVLVLTPVMAFADPVTFTWTPPAGKSAASVSLRGSMNNWGETPLLKQDDGSWSVTVDLAPGDYEYKYFIGGQWPSNMETGQDGGPIDAKADAYKDDGFGGKNAIRKVMAGAGGAAATPPAAAVTPSAPAGALGEGKARIHYHRPDGQYDGFGLHVWEDTPESVTWDKPLPVTGRDDFGVWWDVRLKPNAAKVGFIVHKGDQKDPGPDMMLLPAEHGREVWLVSGRNAILKAAPDVSALAAGDLSRFRAHWVRRNLILWPGRAPEGAGFRLHAAPRGGLKPAMSGLTGGETIALAIDPAGIPADVRTAFPHLAGMTALRLAPEAAARAGEFLKGQVAVAVVGADGRVRDSSGIQTAGVLDDLFYFDGELGVSWNGGVPTVRLWAPTARAVTLRLYPDAAAEEPARVVPLTESAGVWSVTGEAGWNRMYYLYDIEVYVPATGVVETNRVTDPYSRSLARNSTRSQLVNLADADLRPAGWDAAPRPPLAAPEDITLYELHVRDFSALDTSVPAAQRGTYLAFTRDAPGTRHLKRLAAAGLTHIHLLPTFDLATIDEDRTRWQDPGDLSRFPADAPEQQAAVARVRDSDGYNWGYDPWHFGVPEGSYATEADGTARLVEFRRMVQALNAMGLRVVMDVVYNHTNASGQNARSVFDRIVPGYYHRLNLDGKVETSTCCENTASEHRMMEKFIIDDVTHWARDYRIEGFRFDLMGHHMKSNMVALRTALNALTPARDGVDGPSIYVYGEGWDFGEVGKNARGVNATQGNLAGTGIGTFNDRIRDAIRGGNPFGDRREQGFATGLFDEPNGFMGAGPGEQGKLTEGTDRLKIGLAGNLRAFTITSRSGAPLAGGAMSYGAYADDPQECINYFAAHDNETFWDKLAYAAPAGLPVAERVRMQMMAMSLVGLGQGVPFFHAGEELLRSKGMDSDSYNSGDWFNRLDFTGQTNNFGYGLPVQEKNGDRWPIIRAALGRPELKPAAADMALSSDHFREILAIRKSSPLFRLRTATDIQARLSFPLSGQAAPLNVIVMALNDTGGGLADLDPNARRLLVVFNASKSTQTLSDDSWKGAAFALHPIQKASTDTRLTDARFDAAKGRFTVPARTTAVFVEP